MLPPMCAGEGAQHTEGRGSERRLQDKEGAPIKALLNVLRLHPGLGQVLSEERCYRLLLTQAIVRRASRTSSTSDDRRGIDTISTGLVSRQLAACSVSYVCCPIWHSVLLFAVTLHFAEVEKEATHRAEPHNVISSMSSGGATKIPYAADGNGEIHVERSASPASEPI